MSGYTDFAYVYDRLMNDVDYIGYSNRIEEIFTKYDRKPKLLLDLACGTGKISNLIAKKGIEVIGVDASEDMLSVAREKSAEQGNDILYLCQNAEQLDLFGTVDGAVCCLDSLNHITDYDIFKKAISKVSLFLEKDRLFIFDLNTVYKHKNVLANNNYVLETDGVFCVWQNFTEDNSLTTDMFLDFFVEKNGAYLRTGDEFSERAYTENEIKSALDDAGFEIVDIFDGLTDKPLKDTSERALFVVKKL